MPARRDDEANGTRNNQTTDGRTAESTTGQQRTIARSEEKTGQTTERNDGRSPARKQTEDEESSGGCRRRVLVNNGKERHLVTCRRQTADEESTGGRTETDDWHRQRKRKPSSELYEGEHRTKDQSGTRSEEKTIGRVSRSWFDTLK